MVFGAFSKMVCNLPAQAIPGALDRQCQMLQEDLELGRLADKEDALSILCFKQFIQMVKKGEVLRCTRCLSPDHLEFYREIIVKLVNAGVLPPVAMEQFEHVFSIG